MAVSDLDVDRGSLRDTGMSMDGVAATLQSLHKLIDEHSYIAHLAFGVVGEGARHNYAISREDELTNLAAGIETAQTYADNLHKSGQRYLSAEDANVRTVLYDRSWIPDSSGAFKPSPPPIPAVTPSMPAVGSPADLVAVPAAAALVGSGAMKIAEIGVATAANLKACAGMSALTIGTAIAWAAVVWSDDGSIDQALATWDQVAREARVLFGSDVATVRRALQTAWNGTAATSADERILEFVIAGMALADRAERRVATLREMISQLIWIHRLAFLISTLMLLAIVAAIWSAGMSAFAVTAYAPTLAWIVALIEGLFMSWGLIAMWGDSQEGFALKEADRGSAALAVAAVTPYPPRRNQKTPPPFSF